MTGSGSETFSLEGLTDAPAPGAVLMLVIQRRDGSIARAPVKVRVDTSDEQQVFEAGGLLPRIGHELRQVA